jgi:hypothetical protein
VSYPIDWPEPGKMHFRLQNDRLGRLDLDCDSGYVVTAYDLGHPEVREVRNPNSLDNGSFDNTRYYGARSITLDVTLKPHSGVDKTSAFIASEAQLRDRLLAFTNPGVRSALLLSEHQDNRVKQVLIRGADLSGGVTRQNYNKLSVSWLAPRGVLLSYDRRCYPFSFGADTADTQTITIINEGTVSSHWVATLTGEAVKPRLILNDTEVLQLDYTSEPGDTIIIDSFSRSVSVNGQQVGFKYVADNASWFQIPPGISELTIEQDTYTVEGYPYAYWQHTANRYRDNFDRVDGPLGSGWTVALPRPSTNINTSSSIVNKTATNARDTGTGTVETRSYQRLTDPLASGTQDVEFEVANFYQWPDEISGGGLGVPVITVDVEAYTQMNTTNLAAQAVKVTYDMVNHRLNWSLFRYSTTGVRQTAIATGQISWPLSSLNRQARFKLETTVAGVNTLWFNGQQIASATQSSPPTGQYVGYSLHWRAADPVLATPPRLNFFEAGGPVTGTATLAPDATNWAIPPGTTPPNNPPPIGRPPWAWTTAIDPGTGAPGRMNVTLCYYDQYI